MRSGWVGSRWEYEGVLLPVGGDVEGEGLLLVGERDLGGGGQADGGLRGDGHRDAVGADRNAPGEPKAAGGDQRELHIVDVRAVTQTERTGVSAPHRLSHPTMAQCPSVPVDRNEQRQDKLLGVGSQGLGGLVERGAEAKRDVSCSSETEVSEIPHSPDADGEERREERYRRGRGPGARSRQRSWRGRSRRCR